MQPMKVLLVDDKPENLLALESLLKNPEIHFFRATSGVKALELLLDHDFALALLDVQMPEMDGFELAELMRGTQQTRAIPIIFITAGAQDRFSAFRGYEKGAVDFLFKPLDPHVVKSKVQIFLELDHQRQLLFEQLQETQRALTERDQALLESREALHTRDEFMSIASHELKTPLTSLHLQLQMMRRSLTRAQAPDSDAALLLSRLEHSLTVCERQSGNLTRLLNELLDLTRVRLGKLELAISQTDLVKVIRDVIERFKIEIEQKGVLIQLDLPPQLIGPWDPLRIDQIVTNLVSNAIKYGKSRPVKIKATQDQDSVRLVIRDQGIGIDQEQQGKIFERFERAISSTQITGLGLGLYITRQIVAAHGGSISVESELGQGSTFTCVLPVRHVQDGLSPA